MATGVRQPAFVPAREATGEVRTLNPRSGDAGRVRTNPGQARLDPRLPGQIALPPQIRPLRVPGPGRDNAGFTSPDALAARIGGMSDREIRDAVRGIQRRAARARLPNDSVLRLLGPYAEPVQYQRSSIFGGQRSARVHQAHLPQSGSASSLRGRTPLRFQGEAFSQTRRFDPMRSDMPEDWARQLHAGMSRAQHNAGNHQVNEGPLRAGRYTAVRV